MRPNNPASLFWPAVILASTVGSLYVTFGNSPAPVRLLVMLWFLLLCPGLALVRLLHLQGGAAEWTLAVALSLVLDAGVAWLGLWSGRWDPERGFLVLAAVAVSGAVLQLSERTHLDGANEAYRPLAPRRYLSLLPLPLLAGLLVLGGPPSALPTPPTGPAAVARQRAAASPTSLATPPTMIATQAPPVATPTPAATLVPALAAQSLARTFEALDALQTGEFEAVVDYEDGRQVAVSMVFDLGDSARLHRRSTTTSRQQSTSEEWIVVGEQAWGRTDGGPWAPAQSEIPLREQLQPFLYFVEAARAQPVSTADGRVFRWRDPAQDAAVTLWVDLESGTPRQLRASLPRDEATLSVYFEGWNTPVVMYPPNEP